MAKAKTGDDGPAFKIGDTVFLVGDGDNTPYLIVAVVITPNGYLYTLRMMGELVDFYDIELSKEKNVI